MHLPLSRIFEDKRRLVIPVLAGIALNVVLFAGVVYPLGVRVRSMESREHAAAQALLAAAREDADARGITQGRDLTHTALKAFYEDVLPSSHAQARQATFLRLTQLAEQHNLEQSRRSTDPNQEQGFVTRAPANLDDAEGQLRRHPPFHPSSRERHRLHRDRQHRAAAGRGGRRAVDVGDFCCRRTTMRGPMDRKRRRELALAAAAVLLIAIAAWSMQRGTASPSGAVPDGAALPEHDAATEEPDR